MKKVLIGGIARDATDLTAAPVADGGGTGPSEPAP